MKRIKVTIRTPTADEQGEFSIPPLNFVAEGIIIIDNPIKIASLHKQIFLFNFLMIKAM